MTRHCPNCAATLVHEPYSEPQRYHATKTINATLWTCEECGLEMETTKHATYVTYDPRVDNANPIDRRQRAQYSDYYGDLAHWTVPL